MKPRGVNLYTRILLWFLLNAAVLLAAIFAILHWQFREGFRGALGSMASERLQAIGQQTFETLSAEPSKHWTQILTKLGQQHGVKVSLVSAPNEWIAGERLDLPAEIRDGLLEMVHGERGGGPPDRPDPPPLRPPPPPRDSMEEFLFGRSPFDEDDRGPGPRERREPALQPKRYGSFLVYAGEPKRYWSAIRLPPPVGWPQQPRSLPALIIVSNTITGGGLYFDLNPWLIGIFGAMALSALLWIPFVRGITRSIRSHLRATEAIAKGRFDVHVPEDRSDELGRLAHGLNQMAVQLEGLLHGQKRFLGDIAHELCSPVARMEMGLALVEQDATEKQAARLTEVREELREISVMVNELLSFSRAALGQQTKPMEATLLLRLIQDVITKEAIDESLVSLHVDGDLKVEAHVELLRRAIGNVLRNAQLHAPGSPVDISATQTHDGVRLDIADQGPGVPAESLPRLFEPFYRVDASRTRETGGVGLGLSIVKNCVESCGGTVMAENRQPHGLRIIMSLASA